MVRRLLGLALLAVAALTLLAVACGDDGDGGDGGDEDAGAIEQTIRDLAAAWNAKDVDGALALVTDNFLATELEGATREQAREALAEFIGEPPFTVTEVSEVEVSGDTATALVEGSEGDLVSLDRDSFVKEGEEWKLDVEEGQAPEIPDGTTAVDLTLTEYKFTFDEATITSGNIAFNVSNIGGEQHVIDLAKISEDLDIEEALQAEEDPGGIEPVGNIEPLDPGGETTMVFTEPLAPGRYAMICWVEAADGEPHFAKGMWAEFTIE